MWETVTEDLPPGAYELLTQESGHSEATPTMDNTVISEGDELNRISLHDLEAGYPPEDDAIDIRTSNFREVLRQQAEAPSLGASLRSVVRRRLPSVDIGASGRPMGAAADTRVNPMRGCNQPRSTLYQSSFRYRNPVTT